MLCILWIRPAGRSSVMERAGQAGRYIRRALACDARRNAYYFSFMPGDQAARHTCLLETDHVCALCGWGPRPAVLCCPVVALRCPGLNRQVFFDPAWREICNSAAGLRLACFLARLARCRFIVSYFPRPPHYSPSWGGWAFFGPNTRE